MEPLVFLGFGATFVPVVLLVLAIVLIAGGRRESDPEHQRPAAIYYALVQFLTVFIVLFALFAAASSLLNLTTDDNNGFARGRTGVNESATYQSLVGLHSENGGVAGRLRRQALGASEDDEDTANAVRAGIVLVIAAAVFLMHERRRPAFAPGSPGRRIWKTYLYAVCFVAIVTAAAAFVGALFSGWEAIAPGITDSGPRSEGLRDMGSTAILAVGAALLFWRNLRWAEPPAPATAPPGFALPPQPPSAPPAAREGRPLEAGTRPARPRPPATKRTAPPRKKSAG